MAITRIERVDELPIIVNWLLKMRMAEMIDGIWQPHREWEGLSYGRLALLFVTYIIHQRSHRLMKMEGWLNDHRIVIEQVTGWSIRPKEATDDHIGLLLDEMGSSEEKGVLLQQRLGEHLIQAYELPTEVARYDTTSFSVHHAVPEPGEGPKELLRFGHSKDNQPSLLQFKQGLGTLDPAGVPLLSQTLSGEVADDKLYFPVWQQMGEILKRTDFLFIADCKAAAVETRGGIAAGQGYYLFPLPMTGETPGWLQEQIALDSNLAATQEIVLPEVLDSQGQPKVLGKGFVVTRPMKLTRPDQSLFTWEEQWFVTRSQSLTERKQAGLRKRLARTEEDLHRLRPRKDESCAAFTQRAHQIVRKRQVDGILQVKVDEIITTHKRYASRGRPAPDSPVIIETNTRLSLTVVRDEQALTSALELAGWRIHVSNAPAERMTLLDSVGYYRDEWLVERGFHRFKKGDLPALPLYLHLPDRIRGLMLLLLLALQALTLIDFVAQRSLAEKETTIAGLVPGNPKMKTSHPSAERLLAAFDKFHLIIDERDGLVSGYLLESLSPLHSFILDLVHLSPSIYSLSFAPAPT